MVFQFLRGTVGDEVVASSMMALSSRTLQDEQQDSSTHQDDSSSLMFITIIVGLICLFYIICTFQCIRMQLCRKFFGRGDPLEAVDGADTVLVHEGRVFNLTGEQRRAVLEAIVSATSKAATDNDVSKKRRRNNMKGNVPQDVEIPGIADGHREMEDSPVYDEEDGDDSDGIYSGEHYADSDPVLESMSNPISPSTPLSSAAMELVLVMQTPVVSNSAPTSIPVIPDDLDAPLSLKLRPRMKLTGFNLARATLNEPAHTENLDATTDATEQQNTNSIPAILGHPELTSGGAINLLIAEDEAAEETKDVEEVASIHDNEMEESISSSLFMPIPLGSQCESFTISASEYAYDEESTTCTDNVCPICISGYRSGDLIFSSPFCNHEFHKECILEWIMDHRDCPICRVKMVTESEISRTATHIVGKTRMVRAVASLRPATNQARSPSSRD